MLPLFLTMTDGKRIQLQLHGSTVEWQTCQLGQEPSDTVFSMAPVPLGEMAPPMQTYALRNGGPAPVEWALDLSPLDQVRRSDIELHG